MLSASVAATLAAGSGTRVGARPEGDRPGRIQALAFDGFTVFDPRAVTAAVVDMTAERGAMLASTWANKIFALSWLETSAGRYSGFAALADAALQHSASSLGIALTATQRGDLVAVYGRLPVWPDAGSTLELVRQSGVRLVFLSNLGADMLIANMRANGLDKVMDAPLSTDTVGAFKPASRAYAMGPRHFGVARDQIGFVAFGGWDALGAKWFGYRTAWINRLGVTAETLQPAPDCSGPDLSAALRLVAL
jgi:2-haloacid dehalogenase